MQDGTVLGGVDVLAAEHGVAPLLDLHRAGEVAQQLDGLVGDEVLREVKVQVAHVERELLDALVVCSEGVLEVEVVRDELVVVGLEGLPLGGLGCVNGRGDVRHMSSLDDGGGRAGRATFAYQT